MTFPTPPGTNYDAAPEIFAYPPQMPGLNTSTAPITTVTTPSVPATTVAQANTTGVDIMAYITSGGAAVTVIKVNGTTTGLNLGTATTSSASVYVPAGATVSMTYASTAPTWVWLAV